MSANDWERVSPDVVLAFDAPANDFLCPISANTFGIDFLEFQVKDYDSGKAVYQSLQPPVDGLSYPESNGDPDEEQMRSVRYTFPVAFLNYKTIRTALKFRVGDSPAPNFRMIEMHYFKGKLVRTYDFVFGFCIPNSENSWEAIYDVPEYTKEQVAGYISSPFAHKSDSYYFVDNKLIMHNKAEYQYV